SSRCCAVRRRCTSSARRRLATVRACVAASTADLASAADREEAASRLPRFANLARALRKAALNWSGVRGAAHKGQWLSWSPRWPREAGEQDRAIRCGAGGGKGRDQGECGPAKHAADARGRGGCVAPPIIL